MQEWRNWQQSELINEGKTVKKTIDVCEWSDVGNYILATSTLCKRRMILNEEARHLVGKLGSDSSLLVELESKQWLLSRMETLPLDQQRYIFNVEMGRRVDYESSEAVPT